MKKLKVIIAFLCVAFSSLPSLFALKQKTAVGISLGTGVVAGGVVWHYLNKKDVLEKFKKEFLDHLPEKRRKVFLAAAGALGGMSISGLPYLLSREFTPGTHKARIEQKIVKGEKAIQDLTIKNSFIEKFYAVKENSTELKKFIDGILQKWSAEESDIIQAKADLIQERDDLNTSIKSSLKAYSEYHEDEDAFSKTRTALLAQQNDIYNSLDERVKIAHCFELIGQTDEIIKFLISEYHILFLIPQDRIKDGLIKESLSTAPHMWLEKQLQAINSKLQLIDKNCETLKKSAIKGLREYGVVFQEQFKVQRELIKKLSAYLATPEAVDALEKEKRNYEQEMRNSVLRELERAKANKANSEAEAAVKTADSKKIDANAHMVAAVGKLFEAVTGTTTRNSQDITITHVNKEQDSFPNPKDPHSTPK